MMETCSRCGKNSEEVRLFDSLEIGLSRKMCERCALISNIPIVKRPSTSQLKDSEKPFGVRERLMRMNHLDSETKKEISLSEAIKKLEEEPELEKPEDLVFKLVDNFKWVIQMERRRKGLSVRQLAESLNESESALNLLEKGIVPSKSFELIQSLEQFLKIKLIKRDLMEQIEEQKKREAIVDSLLMHKKEEIVVPLKQEKEMQTFEKEKLQPKPLSFRQGVVEHMKLRDLQRLNERIDKDFNYPIKTKEEVGEEQTEDIGKEDTEKLTKDIYRASVEAKIETKTEPKPEIKAKSSTPSIYELMKKKEEKDKQILGKEIEIIEEKMPEIKIEPEKPKEEVSEKPKEEIKEAPKEQIDKAKWEELE